MLESDSNRLQAVPTISLLAYLLTILAWQLEVAVLLVYVFTSKKLDPLGHTALLTISGSLTLFAWLRGKREFQRLRWTRGRIPLTRSQIVIISLFLFAYCCVLAWVAERLIEH